MIASLQRAAERNKQVTVLVELTARFDEERNIQLGARPRGGRRARHLRRARLQDPREDLPDRQAHAARPASLRPSRHRQLQRTHRAHLHRLRPDDRSQAFAEDASAFFSTLTGYSDPPRFKKLTMAPTGLAAAVPAPDRPRTPPGRGGRAGRNRRQDELADRRGDHQGALRGLAGGRADPAECPRYLRAASGPAGVSANIEVVSIVDRFLEHSRIYYFLNGGDEQVYLASADWMTRNLDKRVELMFPLDGEAHKARSCTRCARCSGTT